MSIIQDFFKKKNPRNSGSFKPKYKEMGMIQDFSTVL